MDDRQESSEEHIIFDLEEIVWAKITGYPWWPAKITNKPNEEEPCYRVDFLGDNSQYVDPYSVLSSGRVKSANTTRCGATTIFINISRRAYAKPSSLLITPSSSLGLRPVRVGRPLCKLKFAVETKNNYCSHH
jgi:PWWP domain